MGKRFLLITINIYLASDKQKKNLGWGYLLQQT